MQENCPFKKHIKGRDRGEADVKTEHREGQPEAKENLEPSEAARLEQNLPQTK